MSKSRPSSIAFKTLRPEEGIGTYGPYQKDMGSHIIEGIIQDLMNPALKCRFKNKNGCMTLEVEDKKANTTTEHYILPLLLSANKHLIVVDRNFLTVFLDRCNKFTKIKITTPTQFESDPGRKLERFTAQFKATLRQQLTEAQKVEIKISKERWLENKKKGPEPLSTPLLSEAEKEKIIDEQAHDLPAYQFATAAYTENAITFEFNKFLRGEMTNASTLDEDTLQEYLFYLFGIVVLHGAFYSKIPNIESTKAYRIEYHPRDEAKELPFVKNAKLALEQKTNTFIEQIPSITSTSKDSFTMTVAVDEKGNPVLISADHDKGQFFLFQFGLRQKLIQAISRFANENEIAIPPSAIKFTVETNLNGLFVIVKAEEVAPLEAESQISYPLLHAMQHVCFRYSQPLVEAKEDEADRYILLSSGYVLHRPNHGLAHAIRQASYIEDVLPLISNFGISDAKKVCDQVLANEQLLEILQISMLFYSFGREHEQRITDLEPYRKARESFINYMTQVYLPRYLTYLTMFQAPESLKEIEDTLTKFINMCGFILAFSPVLLDQNLLTDARMQSHPMDALRAIKIDFKSTTMNALFKESLEKLTNDDFSILYTMSHVMLICHSLDTPRFPLVSWVNGALQITNPREIVDKYLFKFGLIPDSHKDDPALQEAINEAINALWTEARAKIARTGDRLFEEKTQQPTPGYESYDLTKFLPASTNPLVCARFVGLHRGKQIPVLCPLELSSVKDETGLKWIYYQLNLMQHSKRFSEQMAEFFKKGSPDKNNELFELLAGGIRFISKAPHDSLSYEEKQLNKEIQRSCFFQFMYTILSDYKTTTAAYLKPLFDWATLDLHHSLNTTATILTQFFCLVHKDPKEVDAFIDEYKLDVKEVRFGGFTLLEYAMINADDHLVKHLQDNYGSATSLTKAGVVEILIRHVGEYDNAVMLSKFAKTISESECAEVWIAVINGEISDASLRALLDNLVFNFNYKNGNGQTLLEYAACVNQSIFGSLFYSFYLDKKTIHQDSQGNTFLHLLFYHARELLGEPDDINAFFLNSQVESLLDIQNQDGLTPLDLLLRNQYVYRDVNFLNYAGYMLQEDVPFNVQSCIHCLDFLSAPFLSKHILQTFLENQIYINSKMTNNDKFKILKYVLKQTDCPSPMLAEDVLQSITGTITDEEGETPLSSLLKDPSFTSLDITVDTFRNYLLDHLNQGATPPIFSVIAKGNINALNFMLEQKDIDLTKINKGNETVLEFTQRIVDFYADKNKDYELLFRRMLALVQFKNPDKDKLTELQKFLDADPPVKREFKVNNTDELYNLYLNLREQLISESKNVEILLEKAGPELFRTKPDTAMCAKLYNALKFLDENFARIPLSLPKLSDKVHGFVIGTALDVAEKKGKSHGL